MAKVQYSVMGFGNIVITSCAGIGSKQGSIMLMIREPFDSSMEKSGKNMQEKISRIYIGNLLPDKIRVGRRQHWVKK